MSNQATTANTGQERHVRIHIDQKPYRSPNPTTGHALYQLGHIPAEFVLFREVTGNQEDPLIENGAQIEHLDEDEHFHSGHPKDITVIVNGQPKVVHAKAQSFLQIVALAYNPVHTEPTYVYTVQYSHGPRANREGELFAGQSVKIKNRMVFLVTETNQS